MTTYLENFKQSIESRGAQCNLRRATGGAMSSVTNTTTLTISGGDTFLAFGLSAGSTIIVPGAGAAGADLVTTIASTSSSTQAVLSAACSTTVSGKVVFYGADDTAALNAMIAALPANGGTILIPRPTLIASAPSSLNQLKRVCIEGVNGLNGGAWTASGGFNSGLPTSTLLFTGSGSGTFLNATQTHEFELKNCAIQYANAGFTGKLIDLTGDATTNTNPQTIRPLLANAQIGAAIDGLTGCNLVTDTFAWQPTYDRVTFVGGAIQIICANGSGNFTNARFLSGCSWGHYGTVAIRNLSEGTCIVGGMVERTYDPSVAANRLLKFIDSGDGTVDLEGMTLDGTWFSDVNSGAATHTIIDLKPGNSGSGGVSLRPSRFGGGTPTTFAKVTANNFGALHVGGGDMTGGGVLVDLNSSTGCNLSVDLNSIAFVPNVNGPIIAQGMTGSGTSVSGLSGRNVALVFDATLFSAAGGFCYPTGSPNIWVDIAQRFTYTLTGTETGKKISNPVHAYDRQEILFVLKQDGTGSRTVIWDTKYRFSGGSAPTLSTGANKTDYLTFRYSVADDKWDLVGTALNF